MLIKKYFIFETFRIKQRQVHQTVSDSLNVLKDIKSPCRVKMYTSLVDYVCMFLILQGLFVHHQNTLQALHAFVGSGKYCSHNHNNNGYVHDFCPQPETTYFDRLTARSFKVKLQHHCHFLFTPFIWRGIGGGNDLHFPHSTISLFLACR